MAGSHRGIQHERHQEALEDAKRRSFGQVLLRTARRYHERAVEHFRRDRRYRGMTARHLAIWPHIDFEEGTRITDLALRMEMTKQGVGQLVDELEGFGVVQRIPDPTDGRAKLVCLTETGQTAIWDGLQVFSEVEQILEQALGRSELGRMQKSLVRALDALEDTCSESKDPARRKR